MDAVGEHGVTGAGEAVSFGPFGRGLLLVSKVAATAGGLVFVVLVAMSIVSITGRKLFNMPVPGDVELLQISAAVACSTFFAYCHLTGGDVKVDFFTQRLRPAVIHALDAAGSLLVSIFGGLIAWRTAASAITVRASGEETMILGLPQWWGPLLMVPGFALLAVAGAYMTWRQLHSASLAREVAA